MKQKDNTKTIIIQPKPDSIAWYLERGDKAGALRKLAEVRHWITDMRAELDAEPQP